MNIMDDDVDAEGELRLKQVIRVPDMVLETIGN
jgi:disulfide oxidoreductase YuzD